jgi:putative transcriptional regulator
MAVRYNKLWKLMIDRKMKKKDLQEAAHLTHYQMTKLGRDENITTEIIGSICKALGCSPDDIMEFYDE